MEMKSIYRRIYILLILMGAMGIVTYYAYKLLDYEGPIIPGMIVMQIVYNIIAANAIVKVLKQHEKEK